MPSPPWAPHLPSGTDPATVDLLRSGSLPAAWARAWADEPGRDALRDLDRWVTRGELDERSRTVAGRLAGAGLARGDRVLMSCATSVDLVVAHVAALRAGFVVVPMNGALRQREVTHVVGDARPAVAIVDDSERAAWIAQAAPDTVVTGPAVTLPDAEVPLIDASAPDDGALLCYTSGTTGRPKGALLTHGNLLACSESLRIAWRWTADDRLVLALPLFHAHGLCVGLHGTLLCGGSAVLLRQFDVDEVLDTARAHHASLFFGVPTMYSRLAASARVGELGRLRLCVSGSAPLAAELHEQLTARAQVRVLERYGTTETLMAVSNPYDGERRPGAVGFPLPAVDVALADPGPGDPNGAGEIIVRGPNVFAGYWELPDATGDAFTPDGWFRTGDVGEWDTDGYLSIVGRTKELIISGGFNVYPREVEEVLLAHPNVAEVAVVGTPSDEWGETVTAVVVADGICDEAALVAYAAEQLAPYKRPRIVRFVHELPRNALGKIVRSALMQ